ncbi:hypothetical protein OID55_41510 (plasmid) [Streptomyces sp. NBC_00715]
MDAGWVLARLTYWGAVEIRHRPYYAYEETLGTVGDESGIANSLLSAFAQPAASSDCSGSAASAR